MKHAGTQRCELKHLVIRDLLKLSCSFYDSRIACINAVNVRVDFAGISMERCCESNRCRIRSAAAECCIIIILVDALEACHYDDLVIFQFMSDSVAVYSL